MIKTSKLRMPKHLENQKIPMVGGTQKELAKMTKIRESTISDIVRGTRTFLNYGHLKKL
ncbi:MAG TPA: helix-turn-helix transcriptional regulator [Pseudogracilibacillus sp.]|nr:helix-turn-helix transcriptional regulator [Pseudogracilibacillus sp.]